MTCSEFITYNETSKPKLVYWAEGFNKEGDATVAEMDIHATDRLVPTLTDDCRQTPKAKLGDQIRKRL
jgi:acid stress chaperone HdeA